MPKNFIKTLSTRLQSTYTADYKLNDQTDVTKSFFVYGLSGVGKTTIVLILARNYEKQIPELVNSIDCIKYIHTLELQNLENLDFILQVPLLILDGLENLNPGFKNNLETILTKRIQNNLTTYITSQKSLDSFNFSLDFVTLFKQNILVKELTNDAWLKNIKFPEVAETKESEPTYLSNLEKSHGISNIVDTISTNNSQKHLISLIKGVLNCDSQGNERLARKLAEKYNINFDLIKN